MLWSISLRKHHTDLVAENPLIISVGVLVLLSEKTYSSIRTLLVV